MNHWKPIFLKVLSEALQEKKKKNSRVSMRQFAKQLGVSIGELSELMNGKRSVSREKAVKIVLALKLPPDSEYRMLAVLGANLKRSPDLLTALQTEVLGDWVSQAVLAYYEKADSLVNEAWIAAKLDQPLSEIQQRVQRFLKEGLLQIDSEGRVFRKQELWLSLPEVSRTESVAHHQAHLKVSERILQRKREDSSRFLTLTFLGSSSQIDSLNSEIQQVFERYWAEAGDGPKEELLRFGLQAFAVNFESKD